MAIHGPAEARSDAPSVPSPVGSGSARVLVLWVGHRPGPWVCRSLSRAGHYVLPAHPEGAPDGRMLGGPRPLRYPSATREPGRLLRWIREICRTHAVDVVLPLDEDIGRLLADLAPRLDGVPIAGPDARQYRMLCDKQVLGETAAVAGVGHPAAVAVGPEGRTGDWPRLPSVVKPHRSTAETGGVPSVLTVHDEASRAAAVADLVGQGLGAIVEERIEGRHWVTHCVRAADGRFAGIAARVIATSPREAGTPSVLEVVGNHPPVLDATRRLFALVDYVGLGNAQFFERDGEFLVHDVNLRPPASIGLAMRAGFDGPALGIDAVLGRSALLIQPDIAPFIYVSGEGEGSVVAAGLRRGDRRAATCLALTTLTAGLPGSRMLDPPLWDLAWLGSQAGRAVRKARRS